MCCQARRGAISFLPLLTGMNRSEVKVAGDEVDEELEL
jgi:hypothetical protein